MKIEIKRIVKVLIWLLKLVAGFVGFMLFYGMGQFLLSEVSHSLAMSLVLPVLVSALMLLCYAGLRRWVEKVWPSDVSCRVLLPHTLAGMGMGIGYFIVVVTVMAVCGVYAIGSVEAPGTAFASMLGQYLMVAVGEEVLFRGIMYRMIDTFIGTKTALLVSALFFGLAHYPQGTLWSSIAIALEAGLLLAAAYRYTGTLWLPIGIHWTWNLVQGNVFGFQVSGTESGPSIITPVIDGPEILTGGVFGAEASVIAVVVGAAVAVYLLNNRKKIQTENQ